MANNLLITGIPRSGTSYLCSILNNTRNTVVVNEPEEIFQILQHGSQATLQDYYGHIRARVSEGQTIVNKIVQGRFIEDTNVIDTRSSYIPEVDSPDFLLGTKNTLVYLNTLGTILEQMPDLIIAACVRHPFDTIASWSRVSFPHIRNATPAFLLNYTTGDEHASIETIISQPDIGLRYALWWKQLAGIILRFRERLVLINYESMVVDPDATLREIIGRTPFNVNLKEPLTPSSPRHHDQALNDSVSQIIREHCEEPASLLGYRL